MKLVTEAIQNGMSFAYISFLMEITNIFTDPINKTLDAIDEDLEIGRASCRERV